MPEKKRELEYIPLDPEDHGIGTKPWGRFISEKFHRRPEKKFPYFSEKATMVIPARDENTRLVRFFTLEELEKKFSPDDVKRFLRKGLRVDIAEVDKSQLETVLKRKTSFNFHPTDEDFRKRGGNPKFRFSWKKEWLEKHPK